MAAWDDSQRTFSNLEVNRTPCKVRPARAFGWGPFRARLCNPLFNVSARPRVQIRIRWSVPPSQHRPRQLGCRGFLAPHAADATH